VRAHARVVAERDAGGGTVLRELRSMAPLMLVPQRFPRRAGRTGPAVVHLVNSAAAPLGGDELEVTVRVGAGARLRLSSVAATLAMPGPHGGESSLTVTIEVADGASLEYLPQPTVITERARHESRIHAELAGLARLRCGETIVLGREGERSGRMGSTMVLRRDGKPLLCQRSEVGDPVTDGSPASLAGRRVLGTEVLVWGEDPAEPAGDLWWSLVPLAVGGSLATAVAGDTVTAAGLLDLARAAHPGWGSA
jgi:urease accessory protein